MNYEVYVDSLFAVNFVMNLYLLMLTNISVGRTATRLRLITASALGAGIYVLGVVICLLPPLPTFLLQMGGGAVLMIKVAFRPCSLNGYRKVLEILLAYSLVLGGAFHLLATYLEAFAEISFGVALVLGFGGVVFMGTSYLSERRQSRENFCVAFLQEKGRKIKVTALLDNGNGLTEPISKKPVSVIDKSVAEQLWPEGLPEYYRVIPFHTVGNNIGYMKGYPVEQIILEQEGILGSYKEEYVAVAEYGVSKKGGYNMILNPKILQSARTLKGGKNSDIKSSGAR